MPAGFGAMRVLPTDPVTALQALRAVLGAKVRYADGTNLAQAARTAKGADVAVVVVYDFEAELYDRPNLRLPYNQDRLVRAVEAANRNTVVVLETGSSVVLPWLAHTRALLETWYPGETAGTSLADILSGKVNPSGKLPVTFPTSATKRPDVARNAWGGVDGKIVYSDGVDVGYRWYQAHGVAPRFPFGYGLSYTTFGYRTLRVSGDSTTGLRVTATVTNTGQRAGTDTIQVYLGDPAVDGEAPRQLRGFKRVTLRPGQSTDVTIVLTPGDLAAWSDQKGSWLVAAGTYRISVGDSSSVANLPLSTTVRVRAADLGVNAGPALEPDAPSPSS